MKRVILSFDYELFFGDRCGTIQRSILDPTRQILDALDKVGGKAVFFVDYLMLKRMREECDETRREVMLVEAQLKEIVRRGSRIELHLHPHWIDAKYLGGGQWDFSKFDHYCLDSLPQSVITEMFVNGAEYLNKVARDVIPDYHVNTFRAGGWAILPFSKLVDGFMKSGIVIDSSVCGGREVSGYTYKMDFSDSPADEVYRFDTDVLNKSQGGAFSEVQITSFKFNLFSYVINSLYRKYNAHLYKCVTDGTHQLSKYEDTRGEHPVRRLTYLERLALRFPFCINETSKWAFLLHVGLSSRKITVIMGHPKDFNKLTIENILFLGRLVEYVDYQDVVGS